MSRILVADDDRDIRELVVARLELSGFEVVALADGSAALETLLEGGVDLAVLDVSMSGQNGIEVCRRARADARIADIPLILLSARAQADDVERGLEAGATDYVVKPFSPRELLERVRRALGERG